jgi:hypothetical protein
LSLKERRDLEEAFHDTEVIQRRDKRPTEQKPEFKDVQLEAAMSYLREQIKTTSARLGAKAG